MRSISEYPKCTRDELIEELCSLTSTIAAAYTDLATTLGDQQSDYLQAYSTSPGSSVAAKNREAQYYTSDLTRQVFEARARIDSLTLCRDLLVFLLGGLGGDPLITPHLVPFPTIAKLDDDSLATP